MRVREWGGFPIDTPGSAVAVVHPVGSAGAAALPVGSPGETALLCSKCRPAVVGLRFTALHMLIHSNTQGVTPGQQRKHASTIHGLSGCCRTCPVSVGSPAAT
jgi:hypothetical protein